jgi:tRNA acetyltransferase TAN1
MRYLITCTSGLENFTKKVILNIYPNAKVRYTYFKGVLLTEIPDEPKNVVEKLRNVPTIAKVFPVHCETTASPEKIKSCLLKLKELWPKDGESYKLDVKRRGTHQFTSRDLIRLLAPMIPAKVSLEAPDVVIRIDILQDKAYVGIARRGEYLQQEPEIKKKWKDRERPLNRAQLKLEEALKKVPRIAKECKIAVDLGAAPGGWSKVLASFCEHVYAVDPAELLIKPENVEHLRMKLEDFEKIAEHYSVDLVTCDINASPEEILEKVLKVVKSTGAKFLVYTIKLPDTRPATVLKELEYVKNILNKYNMKILYLGKLRANTRFERTLIAETHGN